MKPNLFDFATSELSNDAIICWLVSWINYNDNEFKRLSEDIIRLFTNDDSLQVHSINVIRQYKNIDIILEVNDRYVIVIEDKTFTSEHNNQCKKYKDIMNSEEKYKDYTKYYVYLKIGNESFDDRIVNIGYQWVSRSELLATLKLHEHINSDLLHNYIDYLQKLENNFLSYKEDININNWSSYAWHGFYTELQSKKNIKKRCWSYVAHPGKFIGFFWNYKTLSYTDTDYVIYLQIEPNQNKKNRIAFKLNCENCNENLAREIRSHVCEQLKSLDLILDVDIRLTKVAMGENMTFAEISNFNILHELEQCIVNSEFVFEKLSNTLDEVSIVVG